MRDWSGRPGAERPSWRAHVHAFGADVARAAVPHRPGCRAGRAGRARPMRPRRRRRQVDAAPSAVRRRGSRISRHGNTWNPLPGRLRRRSRSGRGRTHVHVHVHAYAYVHAHVHVAIGIDIDIDIDIDLAGRGRPGRAPVRQSGRAGAASEGASAARQRGPHGRSHDPDGPPAGARATRPHDACRPVDLAGGRQHAAAQSLRPPVRWSVNAVWPTCTGGVQTRRTAPTRRRAARRHALRARRPRIKSVPSHPARYAVTFWSRR